MLTEDKCLPEFNLSIKKPWLKPEIITLEFSQIVMTGTGRVAESNMGTAFIIIS